MRTLATWGASLAFCIGGCASDAPKSTTGSADSEDDGGSGSSGDGSDAGTGSDGGVDSGSSSGDDTAEDPEAWRSDPRLEWTDELTPDLISLVAPNWGGDLAVDGDAVTVQGSATESTVTIDWSTDTTSGSLSPDTAWEVADIPLQEGDNTLTFTATDADGRVEVEVLRVTANADSGLSSGLQLSLPLVEVGASVEVAAWVHASEAVDAIEVGPADASGALTEVWASLSDGDQDGRWGGTLTVPVDAPASYSLRARARTGSSSGLTPAVDFEVVPPLTDAELASLDDTMDWLDAAMDAAGDHRVDRAEAATRALLADPDVEVVLLDATGERVQFRKHGLTHLIYQPGEGAMGSEAELLTHEPGEEAPPEGPSAPPHALAPSASPAALLRAQTRSSAGLAGPPPPPPIATPSAFGLAAVSPFSDHFTGNFDPDGDGEVDAVFPLELAQFLPAIADARELSCPSIGEVSRTGITTPTDADLSAVRDALYSGFFNISSHGMISNFYGPSGRGTHRGVVATRQSPFLSSLSTEDKAHWRAGNLLRMSAHGEWVLGFDGSWIRAIRPAGDALDNIVAAITACNSGATVEPLASFMAAGAAAAWAYTDSIDAIDGLEADVAILRRYLERDELNERLQAVSRVYPKRGGRLVWLSKDDVYLGDIDGIQNGSFETLTAPEAGPADHWTTVSAYGTEFDAFVVSEYLSTEPTEGSNLLYMFVYDGDPTYNEVGQNICPVPSRWMQLTFWWQVRTDENADCSSTGVPNWMNVRIQAPDMDSEILWHEDWSTVCPMLSDTGEHSQKSTGWQKEVVLFEAPDTEAFDEERLVFTVGGYSNKIWLGFLDDVQLAPVD